MINVLYIFIAVVFVTIVGGSIGYVIWVKTRPKKETYNAKIYILGDGVIESLKKEKGVIDLTKMNLKLRDLRPFSTDVIERTEKDQGVSIYKLQKLNKPVGDIDGAVESWGKDKKEISVIKVGDQYTCIKKSYNENIGKEIYHPLPHSRIAMIKNEMAIRKDRLHSQKDILQAITPFIVAGICMVGLVCLMYIGIQGMVKMSENANEMAGKLSAKAEQLALLETKLDTVIGIKPAQKSKLGQQANNQSNIIPMIE